MHMHGENIQECSYKKWLGLGLGYQKCTNRARNGGVQKVVMAITRLFLEVGTCNHNSGSCMMMIEFLIKIHQ